MMDDVDNSLAYIDADECESTGCILIANSYVTGVTSAFLFSVLLIFVLFFVCSLPFGFSIIFFF